MQIVQFVFGGSYAFAHLFISYSIPVSIPYNVISSFSAPISSISTAISSATAAAAASGGVGNLLKKIALRAAGEEGLAENVAHAQQSLGSGDVTERLNDEIRYRIEYQTVPCIDTSGEVFAILLNVAYLMPLTYVPHTPSPFRSKPLMSGRQSTAFCLSNSSSALTSIAPLQGPLEPSKPQRWRRQGRMHSKGSSARCTKPLCLRSRA